MADYKQGTMNGTFWHRFARIFIANPRGAAAEVNCFEEKVLVLEDGTESVTSLGPMKFIFDPQATIALLDPLTGDPTGATIAGWEVHQAIFSYVMDEAKKRDQLLASPPQ
ncbi:MAG: hypothetical protein ABIT83_17570 [Massilia sp.]